MPKPDGDASATQVNPLSSPRQRLDAAFANETRHSRELRHDALPTLLAVALRPRVRRRSPRRRRSCPPARRSPKLDVRPAKVELTGPFAYAQLARHRARSTTARRIDVTRIAKFDARRRSSRSTAGLVRPDGRRQRRRSRVSLGGQSVDGPRRRSTGVRRPTSRSASSATCSRCCRKLGCNAGTCHGGPGGKNGFKLSLRGYDPLFDHRALTDDLDGRRFNRAAPETQPDAAEAGRRVPHAGGVVMQPGEPYYETDPPLDRRRASSSTSTRRASSRIEVFPKNPTVAAARAEAAVRGRRHLRRRHASAT